MKKKVVLVVLFGIMVLLVGGTSCKAEIKEQLVDAPVKRVNLFKNGIGMVTRTFEAGPNGGTFIVMDAPDPVHGTFWVQSVTPVGVRVVNRDVPGRLPSLDRDTIVRQLADKEVDLFLDNGEVLSGTLIRVTEEPEETYKTNYEQSTGRYYGYSSYYSYNPNNKQDSAEPKYIAVETDEGTEFIDLGIVRRIRMHGEDGKYEPMVRRSVLLFTVEPALKKQVISFSYLTKGLSWAPSYRLDVDGMNNGMLTMKAAIKNELIDIDDAEFYLISGFPSIRFSHVKSPLSPNTEWNNFFTELAYDPQTQRRNNGTDMMAQAVLSNSVSFSSFDSGASTPMPDFITEDYDIHHFDAGRHSVARGESIAIQIANAPVEYSRIVEWLIPNDRDRFGLYFYYQQPNATEIEKMDDVWDAIRVNNPFDFPMTTAPMSVYMNGLFYGQNMTYWTAPGQEFVARVTKALNIKVLHSEQEVDNERNAYSWLGRTYQRCKVKAKVYVSNNRNKTERIFIRRQFLGKLLSSTGNPVKTLLNSGVFSLNEHSQLSWDIELKPGEEKTLTYEYEVYSRQ